MISKNTQLPASETKRQHGRSSETLSYDFPVKQKEGNIVSGVCMKERAHTHMTKRTFRFLTHTMFPNGPAFIFKKTSPPPRP